MLVGDVSPHHVVSSARCPPTVPGTCVTGSIYPAEVPENVFKCVQMGPMGPMGQGYKNKKL